MTSAEVAAAVAGFAAAGSVAAVKLELAVMRIYYFVVAAVGRAIAH